MRYYRIEITDPANANAAPQVYTSLVNGQNDPGALNVMLDIYTVPYATPRGASAVSIWGIPLQSISNAANLNNKNVKISAGFSKGLPLANPAQAGVIVQGFIQQCYGNWRGNEMTLNLIIVGGPSPASTTAAPTGTYSQPLNGAFQCQPGTQLGAAVGAFLKAAMPGYAQNVQVSNELSVPYPLVGAYRTLGEFAQWLKQFSKQLLGGSYAGIDIRLDAANMLTIYDGTAQPAATSAKASTVAPATKKVTIQFQELIGQPTWIGPALIQFECPMRADVQVGDTVVLPDGYYGIAPSAAIADWNNRFRSAQQGTFTVTEVHHLGNFRSPSPDAWLTAITAAFAVAA